MQLFNDYLMNPIMIYLHEKNTSSNFKQFGSPKSKKSKKKQKKRIKSRFF